MPRFPYAAGVAIVALLVTACASVPPNRPVSDLKGIVGRWEGFGGAKAAGPLQSGRVELTIREDGSGELFLPQLRGGTRVPVSFTVSDGKVLYETSLSRGTLTLHEGDGKRLLQGEAVRKDGTGTSWIELSPAK